ncbi:MAG TPA: AbrB/MazE/SpoVT family DNA-binding domain-containing protein [Patescibacteria group bacterium]|nr:AbrB/MazE/SpoVT family DNA-binding domain-containing protein [Patescibacteria group bacterium]
MNQQKIIKAGNSLAITLPSRLVRALGLRAGDPVTVGQSLDQTQIVCHFDSPRQLSLTPAAPREAGTQLVPKP